MTLEALQPVMDTALDAVIVMAPDGNVAAWNKVATATFGWDEPQAVGRALADLIIPEELRAAHREGLERFLRTGKERILDRRIEIEAIDRGGRRFPVELSVTCTGQGDEMLFLGFVRDISARRTADERMRQTQRLEAIGQLTGGIAHDFNNLLTVIIGNAELLAEKLDDDEDLREVAELTLGSAERGAELTKRLLAFARQMPLAPTITDVGQLIVGMEGLLRRTLGEHVEIELFRKGVPWTTLVDASQLENALLNLCINARDAMPRGGKLIVETSNIQLDAESVSGDPDIVPGDYVMIAVSDTGSGMTQDVLERVFEPFFTTKPVGEGSGLGLSMVYGFIRQSNGYVRIYSHPGEGTTVKLYLPRHTAGAVASPEAKPAETVPPGSEKILLVEDERAVRDHVARQLKRLGYEVVEAGNAVEALRILGGNDPIDLLFTDIIMPGGMNGRELAAEAMRLRPDLKILFTSGYTEEAFLRNGRLDAGVHLLSKPYRRQELAEKLRTVFETGL